MIITSENIIIAKFKRNLTLLVDYRYQYDYGQFLQFDGLELPESFEVHFSNFENGESITQIGIDNKVKIPDELFITGDPIYGWLYVHEGEHDGRTKYMVTIPIKKRAEITDIVPTPEEQSAIEQAIVALNIAVEKSEQNVLHYPKIVNNTWFVYNVNEDNWVDTGVIAMGEDGFSPIASVSKIGNESTISITDRNGTTEETILDGIGVASTQLNEDYTLTIRLTDGTSYTTPSIRGEQGMRGIKGDDGVSIVSTVLNNDYTLTITFSDGTNYTTSSIRGASGADGFSPIITTKQEVDGHSITIKTATGEETISLTDGEDGVSPSVSIYETISGQHTVSITDKDGTKTFNVLDGEKGDKGDIGLTGNGISSAVLNQDYTLTITFTDGTSYTTPSIRGAQGATGQDGISPQASIQQTSSGAIVTVTDVSGTSTATLTNGQNGVSPSISIAEITDGHRVSVMDAEETQTFDVMDGQDGEDGSSAYASVSKSGSVATITLTDKNGTTTAEISDGSDGYSPSANVSKSGNIATISITDKSGTSTAIISDGAKGEQGNDGYSPQAVVNKVGSNATITIKDKNGTTTATVSDGASVNVLTESISGGTKVTITDSSGDHVFNVMNGNNGDAGYSPQASVNKSGSETIISITDSQGTTTATVNDGVDGIGFDSTSINALFDCLIHLSWTVPDGRLYYNALYNAMGGATDISLEEDEIEFTQIGDTTKLIATTTPIGGEVTWASSDENVATVSSNGLVTSEGVGTATITALCGGTSAVCAVEVNLPNSIEAIYTQSSKVFENASIDDLRDDLIVTASWLDGRTKTITDYILSGTIALGVSTITVTYGSLTDTFTVNVETTPLYNWDFTKSIIDTINGNVAELLTGLTQTSSGLNYNSESQSVKLPLAYSRGRAIEIDVTDFDIQDEMNHNVRFVMTSTANGMLIWRWKETIGWSSYRNAWSSSIYGDLTDRNTFANSTIRIEIPSDGHPILYKNGVLIGTSSIEFSDDTRDLYIGSTDQLSLGGNLYNVKITGIRIY